MSANTSQHNDSTSSSTAMNIEQLVPADEESIAALEFIGFTKATAHQIYQAWNTRPEQYPYSFLEHATGSLGNMHQGDTSDTEYMTVSQDLEWESWGGGRATANITESTEARAEEGVPGCYSGPAVRQHLRDRELDPLD